MKFFHGYKIDIINYTQLSSTRQAVLIYYVFNLNVCLETETHKP